MARHQAKLQTVIAMNFAPRMLTTAALTLVGVMVLYAGEQSLPVSPAPTPKPLMTAPVQAGVPGHKVEPTKDLREVLAQTTQERNRLIVEHDALLSRLWFIAVYALAITIAAAWLIRRVLVGPQNSSDTGTDVFGAGGPATTGVTARKNATITIRNRETQRAEVTGSVTTRRFFTPTESPSESRTATAHIERRATAQQSSTPSEGHPELEPQPLPQSSGQPQKPITARNERRPITMRVEQQASDRMDAVDVELKPGTGRIVRRDAFSLVEVMISIAMLATILAAVISGSYTLRRSQQASTEQTQVRELSDLVAERIMGASWDWIGRDRPDEETETQIINGVATLVTITNDYRRGAWSWHRRKKPLSASALPPLSEDPQAAPENHLQTVGLIKQPTGIRDLKLYVEYYTSDLLGTVFSTSGVNGPFTEWEKQASAATGADLSYILPEEPASFDLSKERRALVVRLLITWTSSAGGERQHQLVFARRK